MQQSSSSNSNETKLSRAHSEHRRLLINVKQTIESLFLNKATSSSSSSVQATATTTSTNLFDTSVDEIGHDGLFRLHTAIEAIFINGLRIHKPDVSFFLSR